MGDADGFSILYYQDVDSLVYWANEAAYRWGLRGIAIWSLGQEDMRLWEVMPKLSLIHISHIHWMLTVMNHGTASIFTALRNNTNGAKDKFLTELVRIMEKYPVSYTHLDVYKRQGPYRGQD